MKVTVYDVPAWELIEFTANNMKNDLKLEQPSFTILIKTGAHNERAPLNKNWYYIRLASILRKIYIKGPLGTETLRTYYGGKRNRGVKPNQFRKASGKLIRTCLQDLEKAGLIVKEKNKGRKITPKGISYLNKNAMKLHANFDKILQKREEQRKQRYIRLKEKEKELEEAKKVKDQFRKIKKEKKKEEKKTRQKRKKEKKEKVT